MFRNTRSVRWLSCVPRFARVRSQQPQDPSLFSSDNTPKKILDPFSAGISTNPSHLSPATSNPADGLQSPAFATSSGDGTTLLGTIRSELSKLKRQKEEEAIKAALVKQQDEKRKREASNNQSGMSLFPSRMDLMVDIDEVLLTPTLPEPRYSDTSGAFTSFVVAANQLEEKRLLDSAEEVLRPLSKQGQVFSFGGTKGAQGATKRYIEMLNLVGTKHRPQEEKDSYKTSGSKATELFHLLEKVDALRSAATSTAATSPMNKRSTPSQLDASVLFLESCESELSAKELGMAFQLGLLDEYATPSNFNRNIIVESNRSMTEDSTSSAVRLKLNPNVDQDANDTFENDDAVDVMESLRSAHYLAITTQRLIGGKCGAFAVEDVAPLHLKARRASQLMAYQSTPKRSLNQSTDEKRRDSASPIMEKNPEVRDAFTEFSADDLQTLEQLEGVDPQKDKASGSSSSTFFPGPLHLGGDLKVRALTPSNRFIYEVGKRFEPALLDSLNTLERIKRNTLLDADFQAAVHYVHTYHDNVVSPIKNATLPTKEPRRAVDLPPFFGVRSSRPPPKASYNVPDEPVRRKSRRPKSDTAELRSFQPGEPGVTPF